MILPLWRQILVPGDLDGHVRGQDEAWRAGMAKIRSALPLSFALTSWAKRTRRTEGGKQFHHDKKRRDPLAETLGKAAQSGLRGGEFEKCHNFLNGVYDNLSDCVYNNSLEESFFIHRVPFP